MLVWRRGFPFSDNWSVAFGIFAISVLTGCALIGILQKEGPAFLTRGPLKSIGKYSYAMYVFHWPILFFLTQPAFLTWRSEFDPTEHDLLWLAAATFSLSYIGARISWVLLEQPFLALKVYFPSRVGTSTPATP
jgi:peptidoglycan/LPS O-acetylase OafA/YrhL